MIRFNFSLRRRGNRRFSTTPATHGTLLDLERTQAPEPRCPSRGPGWFDSSWDLIRGLDVREGPPESAFAERDEQPGARLVPASHGAFVDALQLGDFDFAVAPK